MRGEGADLESPGQEHFGGRVWRALVDGRVGVETLPVLLDPVHPKNVGCISEAAQLERWDPTKEGLRLLRVLWAVLCFLGRTRMAGSHHSLGGSG